MSWIPVECFLHLHYQHRQPYIFGHSFYNRIITPTAYTAYILYAIRPIFIFHILQTLLTANLTHHTHHRSAALTTTTSQTASIRQPRVSLSLSLSLRSHVRNKTRQLPLLPPRARGMDQETELLQGHGVERAVRAAVLVEDWGGGC